MGVQAFAVHKALIMIAVFTYLHILGMAWQYVERIAKHILM